MTWHKVLETRGALPGGSERDQGNDKDIRARNFSKENMSRKNRKPEELLPQDSERDQGKQYMSEIFPKTKMSWE